MKKNRSHLGLLPLSLLALAAIAAHADDPPRKSAGVTAPHGPVWAADTVDAGPRGPSLEQRLTEIRRRIQQAVVYPEEARQRGLSGRTLVGFEIDPGGHAVEIRTRSSSGHAILDRAAERAVVDAGALPRVLGRLEVPVGFILEE